MASRGAQETNQLKKNVQEQLNRLLTQLKDLEDNKEDLVRSALSTNLFYSKKYNIFLWLLVNNGLICTIRNRFTGSVLHLVHCTNSYVG